MNKKFVKYYEKGIKYLLALVAGTSILILFLIFIFLFKEGIGIFAKVGILNFIFGMEWLPASEPPIFGAMPMIVGSLVVTVGAGIIAIPFGIGIAMFLAEVAPRNLREILKAIIELLAGIPSVVYGFIGLIVLSPIIKDLFNLSSGLNAFTASLVLGIMALPTVVSISEDALNAVPDSYREASLALGATKWETTIRIILPSARSGLLAASMLGLGRAIGETMAVLMVAGNATIIPHSVFDPVRTITADIAAEMGETVQGGTHYQALFGLGVILFSMTFVINLITDLVFAKTSNIQRGAQL
ncbi:MAG: phosphate ABC transporter permease subunit PstC [Clostridiales bacterium]|nr:phosphate ABC transporter permease subunit PstC [Clostridiales bacterium]MCF8021865.1 phosphate ABC transporter permease subunit PstC [Clostridiales bacterium]